MFKKFMLGGWGVIILTMIYLSVMGMYFEYIINREVLEVVQLVLTLGVLVYTVYMVKLIINLVYNFIKKEEND
jgi:hypothetical protein